MGVDRQDGVVVGETPMAYIELSLGKKIGYSMRREQARQGETIT